MSPAVICSDNADMLRAVLPARVEVAETRELVPLDEVRRVLFDDELRSIRRAVPSRTREYATGRACARTALGALGVLPAPLLSDDDRAPRWPSGVVGSITHCQGMCAAAVARASELSHLGVDCEPNEDLPHGLLDIVSVPSERARMGEVAGVAAGRLLFSAKESVFKATFPADREWRDFHDVEVDLRPGGTFSARAIHGSPLPPLTGRWAASGRLLVTTAWAGPPFSGSTTVGRCLADAGSARARR